MTYKDALQLAKISVMAAKQQIGIAADLVEEFNNKNSRSIWATLNSIDCLLFNLHYYIMDKFENDDEA